MPGKKSEEKTPGSFTGGEGVEQRGANPVLAEELKGLVKELQSRHEALELQNREIQRERDHYEELYETGPSAQMTISARSGKIIEMNLSAASLLKIDRKEAYRKEFVSFLEPQFRDVFNTSSEKTFSNPYRDTCEVQMHRQDGPVFWALLDIGGEPKLNQIRIAVTDITERRQVEQIKDDFIGMVSHELRTPLTVIMGSVNVALSEGISPAEIKDLLEQASESSESLSHILDNLIELSRYQSKRLELTREDTDVSSCLREIVHLKSGRFHRRRISLDLPEKLPDLYVDRLRLRQIMSNLLDNAEKYSQANMEIKITAGTDGDYVSIGVHDLGTGISPEDQSRLFEPFKRLKEKSTTNPGLGLGLLVCRRLIEAHGGKIWVESSPMKGSTFWFTLPVNASRSVTRKYPDN